MIYLERALLGEGLDVKKEVDPGTLHYIYSFFLLVLCLEHWQPTQVTASVFPELKLYSTLGVVILMKNAGLLIVFGNIYVSKHFLFYFSTFSP